MMVKPMTRSLLQLLMIVALPLVQTSMTENSDSDQACQGQGIQVLQE